MDIFDERSLKQRGYDKAVALIVETILGVAMVFVVVMFLILTGTMVIKILENL